MLKGAKVVQRAPAAATAPVCGRVSHGLARDGAPHPLQAADSLCGRYAPARVEAFVLGQQLGPVAGEAREKMLTCSGAEVEQVRPHAARARFACRFDDSCELARVVGEARQDRSQPDAGAHTGLHELPQAPGDAAAAGGARLGRAPDVVVDRRDRERHRDVRPARRFDEHVHVTDDQRPARDDRERLTEVAQHLDARACEAVTALRRLVGVRRGADRDPFVARARAPELASQHLGDVRLHPDRRAVAVVGGAVGALLEPAHVTERATVDAAHVRIQRPLEGHALDVVERHLAGLLAVGDAHPDDDTNTCSICPAARLYSAH